MSEKIGKIFIIQEEKPNLCEFCGKIAETRPYGKNSANICFACSQKPENINEVNKNANILINSASLIVKI